jgi:transcriptional regulator with XRE-family HTH domain
MLWTQRVVACGVGFTVAKPISPATATMGDRVRTRREALGLSQEAMATRCGVHWTFLGQVERGQRNVRLHNLLKVANGLGLDPAELVRGLEPPKDKPSKNTGKSSVGKSRQ